MREKAQKTPEIPEAIRKYLTDATHHHFVSEFLLRRFSEDPSAEHPLIYRLDVKTGEIKPISTRHTAVIQHHNDLSAATGLPAGFAEAILAHTEAQAARLLEKLIHHDRLDAEERVAFSYFLFAQQVRTPRGRAWLRFVLEEAAKFWLLKQVYENRTRSKKLLRKDLGRNPTEEEIERFIQQLAEPLEKGELAVRADSDLEILSMFVQAREIVPVIASMNWTVLKAPDGHSFILSDEPLVRLDAHAPGSPAGWRASLAFEATMPLDPHYCLLLRWEPRQAQSLRPIGAPMVSDINLRTYAGARDYIFGPTEQLLKDVYAAAQARAYRVDQYRPKPPSIYVFEQTEGEEQPSKVTRISGPSKIPLRRKRGHE